MIKEFCDGCGKEIDRNYVDKRFTKELNLNGVSFSAEVIVSRNGVSNQGDLCFDCLMRILREGREI